MRPAAGLRGEVREVRREVRSQEWLPFFCLLVCWFPEFLFVLWLLLSGIENILTEEKLRTGLALTENVNTSNITLTTLLRDTSRLSVSSG